MKKPPDPRIDPLRRRLLAGGAAAWLLPSARAADGVEAALADAAALPALRAVLVARDGVPVAERYYADASAGQLRRVNSATKSVVSMLVGQALAQGRLGGLSQTVAELLPEHAARAPGSVAGQVTLRQILTGTTGLAYDFTRDMDTLVRARDPVQHVLALPRGDGAPGSWSYSDAAVSLLAPILERAYALKLPEIARQGLLAPLGIDTFNWRTDRSGQATSYMGLELRPRDFLQLASMVAEGGRGVVPADWLADSLKPHAAGAWSLPQVAGGNYGYLWFNGRLHDRPVAWAWGYGGQLGFVVPSQRLAIVTLATEPPPAALAAQNRAIGALVARIAGTFA
jgi:CubicO group peptidase (beta-lactamase class C family)